MDKSSIRAIHAARLGRIAAALSLALAAIGAAAQGRPPTTEQLGRDPGALRQEAEQQRARELDQQQRNSQQQQDQQWNDTVNQQRARAAGDAAQGQAVLRSWQQRPPLAAEKNPLLGRWESLGVGKRAAAPGVSPEMANLVGQMLGGITAGLCDSMLGRGTIEFRPAGVVAIGADGRERPMYRAQYRGGGSRVVVLPQGGTSFTHMIIDFDGADRASVAAVGCALRRAGGGATASTVSMAAPAAETAPLQWELLGTLPGGGGFDAYIAKSTVRRSGKSAQMSDLFDFKRPQTYEGRPFLSTRNQYEYDCVAGRRRMLATVGFSRHMGQGAVVASADSVLAWEEIPTTGPLRDYWKAACAKG